MKLLILSLTIIFFITNLSSQTNNEIFSITNDAGTNKFQLPDTKSLSNINSIESVLFSTNQEFFKQTNEFHQDLSKTNLTPIPLKQSITKSSNKEQASSEKKVESKETPSSMMVNFGFFWLQANGKFKKKFSAGYEDSNNIYYRMPFNSWNDSFYVIFSFDWKIDILSQLNSQAGWGFGFNFAGSGGDDDAIKVEADTDLGIANTGEFYAIYNNYHFPLFVNASIQPLDLSIFKFYTGLGCGGLIGIYTYNELADKERSSLEEESEQIFFKFIPFVHIFLGVHFEIIEDINEFFFEINYRFAKDPVITNDLLHRTKSTTPRRSVQFQVSGILIGFGFRY